MASLRDHSRYLCFLLFQRVELQGSAMCKLPRKYSEVRKQTIKLELEALFEEKKQLGDIGT